MTGTAGAVESGAMEQHDRAPETEDRRIQDALLWSLLAVQLVWVAALAYAATLVL